MRPSTVRSEAKNHLESRMHENVHVRFGVGVGLQMPGLHHVRVEPRSNNAIAAGLSSFQAADGKKQKALDQAGLHHSGSDLVRHPEKAQATHRKLRAKDRPLENDFVSDEEFAALLRAWFGNIARVLEPGRAAYIWGGYANVANYPPALKEAGLYFSQAIIWDKQHPVLTRKDRRATQVEAVPFAWRRGAVLVEPR